MFNNLSFFLNELFFVFSKNIYLFIFLFLAALGLSCGTRDLCWGMRDLLRTACGLLGLLSSCSARASLQLWCVGILSLVVACRLQGVWAL